MDRRLEQTIADLMQRKQCLRCGELFSDMEELGSWSCRLHPGHLQSVFVSTFGTERDTFACCGTSPWPWHRMYAGVDAAKGCKRCDHTIHRGLPDTLQIPLERAQVLFGARIDAGINRPGMTSFPERGELLVVRYEGFTAAAAVK